MGQTLEFFSGVGDEEKMFYNLIVVRKLPRVADLCQRGSNAKLFSSALKLRAGNPH